jgi:hypothetical protein
MNKAIHKRRRQKKDSVTQNTLNWSSIMATISATILAVSSVFTSYITFSTWSHIQETSRPYFSITGSPEVTNWDDPSLSMHLVNAGGHPAENLNSHIIIKLAETGQDIYERNDSLLNTTPKGGEIHLLIDLSEWQEGGKSPFAHELYLTLLLNYHDPLLQQDFEQKFYLKWSGLVGDRYEEMTYMTHKELQELLETAKNNLNSQ